MQAVDERSRRKDASKRLAWGLRITMLLLGTAATVLLGLNFEENSVAIEVSRNAALVCTALSTFLAGLAAMWSVDTYWIKQKVIANQLELLLEAIHFRRSLQGGMNDAEVQEHFDRYQEILQQQNTYWEEVLTRTRAVPRSTASQGPANA